MRYITCIVIVVLLNLPVSASTIPLKEPVPANPLAKSIIIGNPRIQEKLFSLSPKAIRKLTGVKLTIKEKIGLVILKQQLKKQARHPGKKEIRDKGKTAFILGIIALAGLVIPFINVFSIPLAILAIIWGSQAKTADPGDRKARTAVTLGIITLATMFFFILLIAAVLAIGTIGPY